MKNKKLFKTLSISTLAFGVCAIMSLSVVLPVVSASTETQQTKQSSALNLDPENDEIIAYTNGGLPIRSHNVVSGTAYSYQYITLGTYNGYDVNWLIVAMSSQGVTENDTLAGQAINNETSKAVFCGEADSSLNKYQVKLISQCVLVNNSANGFGQFSVNASTSTYSTSGRYNGGSTVGEGSACNTSYVTNTSYFVSDTQTLSKTDILQNFNNINSEVVISLSIPSYDEYQNYFPNNMVANEINTLTPVPYTTSDMVYTLSQTVSYSYTKSTYHSATNLCYCYRGTESLTTISKEISYLGVYQNGVDFISTIDASCTGTSTSVGGYGDKSVTTNIAYTGNCTLTVTNIRPMMIVDITQL